MKRFEEIPHTADWSYRAFGTDLKELFANAAHALFTLQGAEPATQSTRVQHAVNVDAIDQEALLVNWLNELLFLQEQYRETYDQFTFEQLTPTELTATVGGKPRAKMDKIIKAVTFHNLKIEQTQDGWQAVLVVDV
jgi:SHS2 domain-containing protein